MTIRAWLEDLGLQQYADAFEAEEIEPGIVDQLDHGTLKELGVLVLGHRLKMLRAASAGVVAPPTLDRSTEAPAPKAAWEAERRQLTIMFSDLVGSTSLSTRLDPEDYRDMIRTYHEAVAAAANEAGGHVAQFLGDGALIYFGYPAAQEDAAERAVNMGLALIEAASKLEPFPGAPVKLRIGIATGMVVVGDIVGRGLDEGAVVSGETPNLAARLQGLAEPNSIVISDRTHRLLGRSFRTEQLDPQTLKGFEGTQTVWRILGTGASDDRFEAHRGQRLSPLVGRDGELGTLMEGWAATDGGHGRTVLLRGEAGLGKSRLLHEVVSRAEGAERVQLQCAPYFSSTSLHPVRRAIEQFARVERDDDADTRLDKVLSFFGLADEPSEDAAVIAAFMGLPVERFPTIAISAERQRKRFFEFVIGHIKRAAEQAPLLFFFEDLHWADPTSVEFLGLLIEAIADSPILIVATFRPEFEAAWLSSNLVTLCDMHRLNPGEMAQIVSHLAGPQALPPGLLDTLSSRAEGVPLFLEELTKSVIMMRGSGGGYDTATVPATLMDTLMARLDRLNTARQIAQIASVIGREFDEDLLAAIADRPVGEVRLALRTLADAELITHAQSSGVWAFHHALIRDAAYESLLRRSRQDLHRKIATVAETLFPQRLSDAPEFFARHLSEAGDAEAAAPHWLTASLTARRRGALKEAYAHVGAGLEQAQRIAPGPDRDALEMQFEMTRGYISFATAGYAAPEAEASFSRAGDLSASVSDPDLLTSFHNGYGVYQAMRGDADGGHAAFTRLVSVAQDFPHLQVYAGTVQTWSLFNLGRFAESLEWGKRLDDVYAKGLWDPKGTRHSTGDPYAMGSCFHAASLWALGFPDQAMTKAEETLEYAKTLNDPFSVIYAQVNGVCRVADLCGRTDRVLEVVAEAVDMAQRYGFEFAYGFSRFWQARALADSGDTKKAIEITSASLAACRAVSVRYHEPHFRAILAILQAREGDYDAAFATLDGVEKLVESSGERWQAADVRCARAEVAGMAGQVDLAEAAWRGALKHAKAMGAQSWELRAALGLASLLAARDARGEARDLLAPVHSAFAEGTATSDLRRAASVLTEIA